MKWENNNARLKIIFGVTVTCLLASLIVISTLPIVPNISSVPFNRQPIPSVLYANNMGKSNKTLDELIISNIGFRNVNFTVPKKDRPHLLLYVAIFSYIKNKERRKAIRNTWLNFCVNKVDALCMFMIDGIDYKGIPLSEEAKLIVSQESNKLNDIVLLDSYEGLNFAYRFYMSLLWATDRFTFDFFLRIDDDYYLCFNRLLNELRLRRANKYLYWGYQHCVHGMTRIDEGWSLFGNDLIQAFIRRKKHLVCHKYGDQAVPLWILGLKNSRKLVTWFGDDRIMHSINENVLKSKLSVCSKYLAIHQSYPSRMKKLHEIYLSNPPRVRNTDIPPTKDRCPTMHDTFNVDLFMGRWHGDLKLCSNKPIWSNEKRYIGRSNV